MYALSVRVIISGSDATKDKMTKKIKKTKARSKLL